MPTLELIRMRLCSLVLLTMAVLSLHENQLRFFLKSHYQEAISRSPQAFDPDYDDFLREVNNRALPGATVGLLTSAQDWNGYFYRYYRALYLLDGRRVIPMFEPEGVFLTTRVFDARYLALWDVGTTRPRSTWVTGLDKGLLVRNR